MGIDRDEHSYLCRKISENPWLKPEQDWFRTLMSKWASTKVGKNQPEKQNQSYIIERIPSVKNFSNLGNSFAILAGSRFRAASIAKAKHIATPIWAFGSCSTKSASARGFRNETKQENEEELHSSHTIFSFSFPKWCRDFRGEREREREREI
jgi:Ni,Fe-hydrogenase I small subunit